MLFLRAPYGEDKLYALVSPTQSSWGGRGFAIDSQSPARRNVLHEDARGSLPQKAQAIEFACSAIKKSNDNAAQRILPNLQDRHSISDTAVRQESHSLSESLNADSTQQRHPGTPTEFDKEEAMGHAANGSYASNGTPLGNGLHRETNGHASPQSKHVIVAAATNGTDHPTATNGAKRIPMHDRKHSNPLAPPFIVSAPGKTIVYGEHAVVHGKAAIAAAISLRSYLLVTTLSKSKRTVSLKFSDIGLDHTWNIHDLPWAAFSHPTKKKKYYDMVTSLDPELLEAMQPHIVNVSPDAKPEIRKVHMSAASSFLYLFLSLGSEHSPPCVYALRSAIPIGAGLGSSASISVCISAALLIQARALAGPHPDQMSHESEEQLERINRWAFVGELNIHGTPSGVDNTVATNGRAVLFQRKDYSKPPMVKVLRDFPELPLLLINTCQAKSTAAEVAKVAHLKKRHPAVADSILDSIDAITRSVHDCITGEDFDPTNPDSIEHLGELMSVNHGLLTSLGVSHPKLERLRYLVDQAGVGWTKLTGAGGGGCAITLLKPSGAQGTQLNGEAAHEPLSVKDSPMDKLYDQLAEEGFERYETTLGGDGVGVLYPAIINDEEIHEDMFLTVEGREGVEELVSGKNDPGAWKYWRP